MNQDLDSPRCPLSKTHLGKILSKSKTSLNWTSLSPFLRDFHVFNLFHWNNGNISKVAAGKSNFNQFLILLRSFQCVFWIEDIEGYPNRELYFTFNYLVCVWESIKVEQKRQLMMQFIVTLKKKIAKKMANSRPGETYPYIFLREGYQN